MNPNRPDPISSELADIEDDLFVEINRVRAEAGLSAVVLRTDLNCAARRHSDDIGERGACSHTGGDGSQPGDRVQDCDGDGWTGEIVACGQTTPADAVDGWMHSQGHHDIMLDPAQVEIGVAMHQNFWTAIFDQ